MSELRRGSCHCGAVEFQVELTEGLVNLRRCNCSLCRRKGAIMGMVPASMFTLLKGEANLTLYQWNTKVARHYFCSTCGIYTHHARRADPTQFGFNVACLEDVDPFALENVGLVDGAALSRIDD